MIVFNELKVVNNSLIIDVSISPFHFDDLLHIEGIYVRTYDDSSKFQDTVSAEAYKVWDINDSVNAVRSLLNIPYSQEEININGGNTEVLPEVNDNLFNCGPHDGEGMRNVRLVKDLEPYGEFKRPRLYFIYVYTTTSHNAPCGLKAHEFIGVAYNKQALYKWVMNAIGGLNDCTLDLDLINQYLRIRAFQLALKAGNYRLAIDYWNMIFGGKKSLGGGKRKHCGCHG